MPSALEDFVDDDYEADICLKRENLHSIEGQLYDLQAMTPGKGVQRHRW